MTCAAILLGTLTAFAGEPAGRYAVVGSNPGGGARYQGTVTVEPTGETFRVTWDIGGQTFVGTGIGTNRGIAVSYRSGNQTGLAIYPKGNDWKASGPIPAAALSAAKSGPGVEPSPTRKASGADDIAAFKRKPNGVETLTSRSARAVSDRGVALLSNRHCRGAHPAIQPPGRRVSYFCAFIQASTCWSACALSMP